MNPLRSGLDRMPKAWKAALGGLAGALALSCCADRVAGTSVGTGNPTEIEVAFRDDAGAALSITGDLSVYAITQIPVEGYAPEPLVKVPVAGADRATLKAEDFKALADSLWPKGSRNGDLYAFNVVVTGESRGAIVRGLTWRKDLNKFVLREEDPKIDEGVKKASIEGPLVPLVAFQGTMDTTTFSLTHEYHLFLYGTGYTSRVSHGVFILPKVPLESHDGFLIGLPSKLHLSAGVDSTPVYSLTSTLEAGTSNPEKGAVYDRVLLPDSLRIR
jgi:hypothetical protein